MVAMARAIIMLAFTVASADIIDGAALSLLQKHAKVVAVHQSDEGQANHTSNGFAAIGAQVGELEQSLQRVQKQHAAAARAQKANHSEQVNTQLEADRELEEANSKLTAAIATLRSDNAALREQAALLQGENAGLEEDERVLALNFTTAKEFLAEAQKETESGAAATELEVLAELDEEDMARQKVESHKHKLEEIAKEGARKPKAKTVLLQKPSAKSGHGLDKEDPKQILRNLDEQLGSLEEAHVAGAEALEGEFEKRMEALSDQHMHLQKEHDKLQATEASLTQLRERLQAAVRHLEASHAELLKRSRSLRNFARAVGNKAMPQVEGHAHESTSLLQLEAHGKAAAQLPAVEDMLGKPSEVFMAMTAQVGALEKRLTEEQEHNKAALESEKAGYEEKLRAQESEIQAVASANAKILEDLKDMKNKNTVVRSRATKLQKDGETLRAGLLDFQSKLATSKEFAGEALQNYNVSGTPEVAVLAELENEEADRKLHKDTALRFDEISSTEGVSFLEIGRETIHGHPKELLQVLEDNFDELAKEQEANEALVKKMFLRDFKAGDERMKLLTKEQAKLNAMKTSLQLLQDRLQAAVDHLERTNAFLTKRSASLHSFVHRMGSAASHSAKHEAGARPTSA